MEASGYAKRRAIGVEEGALVGWRESLPGANLSCVTTEPLGRDLAMYDLTGRTELTSRESNGVTVTLLWSRSTNLVTVAVDDTLSDDYFELVLDEHDSPLDVFHHPFAHAAARGLDLGTPHSEWEVLRNVA
jgi:hypothetical protein